MMRKDGETFLTEHLVRPILDATDKDSLHLVCVVRDVTLQKHAENILMEHQTQLDFLANHDPLTGLSNRRFFQGRLKHALARTRRQKTNLDILFIDLDSFKPVNDRFGHELGDELLTTVAERLSSNVREQDTLARFGGDEFALIVEDMEDAPVAEQIAEKLILAMAAPFEISGHQLKIWASVGISVFPSLDPTQGGDDESLIHHADQAMYRAKQQGGNRFCLYDEDGWVSTCPNHPG